MGILAVEELLHKHKTTVHAPNNFNREFNIQFAILSVLSALYPVDGIFIYQQMFKIFKLLVNESKLAHFFYANIFFFEF